MRTITISEPVWGAIADLGKFGEKEDDVLRRVFKLPPNSGTSSESTPVPLSEHGRSRAPSSSRRRSFATQRMSSYLNNSQIHVAFQGGASRSWALPPKSDKTALRAVRAKAVAFARENGATVGQVNAVLKTLTDADYHLTK